MALVLWSVYPDDTIPSPPPHPIARRVLAHVCPGSIILLHETDPRTVAALPEIIAVRSRGYTPVTLSTLLAAQAEAARKHSPSRRPWSPPASRELPGRRHDERHDVVCDLRDTRADTEPRGALAATVAHLVCAHLHKRRAVPRQDRDLAARIVVRLAPTQDDLVKTRLPQDHALRRHDLKDDLSHRSHPPDAATSVCSAASAPASAASERTSPAFSAARASASSMVPTM